MSKGKIHDPTTEKRSAQWMLKLLNIRREERRPVVLLILFSFFMGMALSYYFTASNAIFIRHFAPRMISLSYMVSGIAVYLTWLLLTRIDKRLPPDSRFIVKFAFILISVVVISIGTWRYDSDVMAFILFTFVRVLVYITMITFWGLAGSLFNLRQGKRIFGLIGTGEAISVILGYFSVPVILHFVDTPFLLFFSSFAFLMCFLVVLIILRTFKDRLGFAPSPTEHASDDRSGKWKYTTLLRQPYFVLISLLALLPIFGYLFVDYMFLHQTKFEFNNDRDTIARFLGYLLGFVAVVELIFKLFVSGRLLNKYGLKPSLLSLPFVLLISTMMAALFGTIYGPAGIFFTFIVFSRLLERSVRVAIYEPAFQLLYQPVPPEQRLAFQSQIEGIPKALGTILTGAVLWLFSSVTSMTLVHYNLFFLIILVFWIVYAIRMYRSYRSRIREVLATGEITAPDSPIAQATSWVAEVAETILRQGAHRFRKLFHLIEKTNPLMTDRILNDLLIRAPDPLQKEMISFAEQKQIIAAKDTLKSLQSRSNTKEMGTVLEGALAELQLAENYPGDLLSNLAHSKDPDEREVSARLLAGSPRYQTVRILSELLRDSHRDVRKAALVSAGKIKRVELWPGIMENLNQQEYVPTAFSALMNIGEPVIDALEDLFKKTGTSQATQIQIIQLYQQIGGEKALKHLRTKISFPDMNIRMQALLALSKLNYRADHREQSQIKQILETNIETMVWIMAGIEDLETEIRAKHLLDALQAELAEKKEQIFLLLSLIYDARTIRLIRENIESGNSQSKIFAMEISDMMVADDIKEMFLPLFDDTTVKERLAQFRNRFPQEKLSCLQRIVDIINKDYNLIRSWTKACAVELLIHYDIGEVSGILCANIVNPSRMISETAAWVLHALNPDLFYDVLSVQRPHDKRQLEAVTKKIGMSGSFRDRLLISEKTEALKNSGLFIGIPDPSLAELAMSSMDVILESGQPMTIPETDSSNVCLILSGQLIKQENKAMKGTYETGQIFIKEPDTRSRGNVHYTAMEDSLLLMISMDRIIDLMRDHPVFTGKLLEWY
ncbi:MAG: hypothetical protein PHD61_07595 [Bacteroidales bacterium]|nr:HEAT repeat domain-containing protein [Lentimicrobiaceae bacterium]MDD5695153.1 hypothetical protein [Bacteroidales bacterium]